MFPSLRRWLAAGSAVAIALIGLTAAPLTAEAVPSTADATKAANYLAKNLPAASAGAAPAITAALGLASTGDCTYSPALRTLVRQLEKGAKAYLYPNKKLNQARAANLAITVKALGLNPRKFAGRDLISLITKSLPKDGRIGSADSAFSQSLALIALDRAEATTPVTVLTKLLSLQDDSGAFGYDMGGFTADPDTTAMSILGLEAVGNLSPQQDKAVAWALDAQLDDGSWPNDYSPVDSTGLLGAALAKTGNSAAANDAKAWLGTQQLADGGFPSSRDGDTSNLMATADALWLINGKTLSDVSLNLSKCPKNPPALPKATGSCTGVWVVVDRGNGQETVRCATKYATGLEALKSAGFAVEAKDGFVNRIHSFPRTLDSTWTKYWGYWSATPQADGTWGAWESYMVGAGSSKPVKGSVEGWYYGGYSETASFSKPPRGYADAPVPTIDNLAPKVGQTLTVTPGTWAPTPDKVAIQWYRSGKAISKATKSTYKVGKADLKKVITVKVTASGAGLQSVSKTSAATAKVTK